MPPHAERFAVAAVWPIVRRVDNEAASDQTQCPACLGSVPSGARACMHCGERFDGRSRDPGISATAVLLAILVAGAAFFLVTAMLNSSV